MQATDKAYIKPSQRLALAALKNSKQLEEDGAKILDRAEAKVQQAPINKDLPPTPPPLPVRPSPAPPVAPHDTRGPKVTSHAVPDLEILETSSTVSSQTLVNQAEDGSDHGFICIGGQDGAGGAAQTPPKAQTAKASDAPILLMDDADADADASVAEKMDASGDIIMADSPATPQVMVEDKIAKALDDSSVTGTDQQDVEEVMGNIIGHLRAAIKATGEDPEINAQTDPVMDLFFWTSASYSRKNSEANFRRTLNPNRWVTAFPDESGATISLMQALDRNFQRELIKEDEARYERFSSIVKLPPILHIHIQRSTRGGGKNMAPVVIPEVLYLDRFMDSPAGSDLLKKRQRSWDLSERLRSLSGPDNEAEKSGPENADLDMVKDYDKCTIDEFIKDDTPDDMEDDGYTVINGPMKSLFEMYDIPLAPPPPKQDRDMGMTRQTIKEALDPVAADELAQKSKSTEEANRRELDGLFEDMKSEKYRLHAVICHAGQSGRSGHYWVWIYDFEKGVWRKYNDSDVTEQRNTEEVMETLSTRGEPYYLAYVRDDEIARMVNIPARASAPEVMSN